MAYLNVHRSLGRFVDQGTGSFHAWLERIVDRRITDVLRQYVGTARRGLAHEVSGPQPLSGSRRPARQPTPSVVAVGEELRRAIEAAIAQLPEDYRRVLRLVQGEGLTLAEAGDRMGRSAGAAKQLYSRALGRLRRLVCKSTGRNDG
jgi:RNA polymerase sigma-70 factor (ECF subfamily)